jgi:short chain dehydrogenase
MFDLSGMNALVTGASGGIGAAVAQALAGQGARLALSGTREDALAATAAQIGGDPLILPCNLSDKDAVEGLIPRAVGGLGQLDILVNNDPGSNKADDESTLWSHHYNHQRCWNNRQSGASELCGVKRWPDRHVEITRSGIGESKHYRELRCTWLYRDQYDRRFARRSKGSTERADTLGPHG